MNKKRIASLLIAGLTLSGLFAACGDAGDKPAPSATASDGQLDAAETTAEETANPYDPGVPESDFGGYTFTFYIRKCGSNFWTVTDIWVEDLTGDALNDAVYNRNQYLSETYNINIAQEYAGDNGSCSTAIQKMVMAGDAVDAVVVNGNDTTTLAMKGNLTDLNTVPYIDFTKPWWDQHSVSGLNLYNKVFFAAGEATIADNNAVNIIAFVKANVTDYGLEDPYQLVRDGTWTLDKFTYMAETVSRDLNGDGVKDESDIMGYMHFGDAGQTMFNAMGNMDGIIDDSGQPQLTFLTERSVSSWQKLIAFIQKDCTMSMSKELRVYKGMGDYDVKVKVIEGKNTLFSWVHMRDIENLRGVESDFGVLPNPKFDEAQASYCNENDPYGTGLVSVPKTCPDLERAGIVIEAFSAKSMEIVRPAYYDINLTGKYMRDNDSEEMLDIIFKSVIYDIGRFYNWGGMYDQISNLWNSKKDTIAASWEKIQSKAEKKMQDTIDLFNAVE